MGCWKFINDFWVEVIDDVFSVLSEVVEKFDEEFNHLTAFRNTERQE